MRLWTLEEAITICDRFLMKAKFCGGIAKLSLRKTEELFEFQGESTKGTCRYAFGFDGVFVTPPDAEILSKKYDVKLSVL